MEKADCQRNISIGALASLPYIGGPLSYIIDKSVPEQVSVRYSTFMKSLEKDIATLKKKIDYSRFETPQFYSMFVKVIHEVICNHIEEKRILYKNILINTVDAFWNCNKNDFFLSVTERLSPDAINYLYLIYTGFDQSEKKDNFLAIGNLMKVFPSQSDYLMEIGSELVRYHLVEGVKTTQLGKQYCNFIFSPIQQK